MHSCLSEFNEEAFRKGMHEEGYNDGFSDGFSDGFDNGFTAAIITFIKKSQSNNISADTIIKQLKEYFSLSEQEAIALIN